MLLEVIADDFTGASAIANTMAEDLQHDLEQVGAEVVGPLPSVADALRLVVPEEAIDGAVLDVNLRGETAYPSLTPCEAQQPLGARDRL